METRFGDPVLAMYFRDNNLVFGTALGQVGLVDIAVPSMILLNELAEESIRGVYITEEGIVLAAVGDLYVLFFIKSISGEWHADSVSHGRDHSPVLCRFTEVQVHESQVLIVVVEDDKDTLDSIDTECKPMMSVTKVETNEFIEVNNTPLPQHSVVLDFYEGKLLWLYSSSKSLMLSHLYPYQYHKLKDFGGTHVSNFWLRTDCVFYVKNLRQISCLDFNSNERCLLRHSDDIVAVLPFGDREDHDEDLSLIHI